MLSVQRSYRYLVHVLLCLVNLEILIDARASNSSTFYEEVRTT